jgi:hypothetical protein
MAGCGPRHAIVSRRDDPAAHRRDHLPHRRACHRAGRDSERLVGRTRRHPGRCRGAGHLGSAADPAHHPAALPNHRACQVLDGVHPARDQAVLHRVQHRGGTIRQGDPRPGLRACQGHQGRRAVRYRARRQRDWLRVPAAFHPGALRREPRPEGAPRRPGLHPAVRHCDAQRFGDELRRAVRQRDRGAQRGGGTRRVRPRHRRRRHRPASHERGRRPDLGDRVGLFRLP